ncbi:MAG: hypothetical protein MI919_39175, partial [Holophagales bacterium]|nr:hypothetical protein [Holophagales bacterium]
IRLAERIAHTYSLNYALIGACQAYQHVRDPELTKRYADRAIALSHELGSWMYKIANIYRVWAEEALDDLEDTSFVFHLLEAVNDYYSAGQRALKSKHLAMLADVAIRRGVFDVARRSLSEAMDMVHELGEAFFEPEIYRLMGDLALADPSTAGEGRHNAEKHYRAAVRSARGRQTKSLELRAACDLGVLWSEVGRRREAKDLIAGIYNWFGEGFETHDLVRARRLLENLSRDSPRSLEH